MDVEKSLDDLCIGEKFQTNTEIAGSPRNSFRASLEERVYGGRALNGRWPHLGVLMSIKLRMPYKGIRSQTKGDKVLSREGKSPDHQLRSSSVC